MAGGCKVLLPALLGLARAIQDPRDAAPSRLQPGRRGADRRLEVAFAPIVPYGVSASPAWRDSLAVLALSAEKVAARSIHNVSLLAILPDTLPRQEEERRALAAIGLEALFVPVPVPLEQVQNDFARANLAKVLGEMEQLKYYGAALTQYDRVVILDGDTMFLQPIDELFAANEGQLMGTYDHELDIDGSAFPPLNTGFLAYTPDRRDFEELAKLVRKGDFRPGTGWEGSHTGWTYGTGSQGILSFYYNQVQPGVPGYNKALPQKGKDLPGEPFTVQPPSSRFLPLDRSVYNVIDTDLLRKAFRENRTGLEHVKHFHFTGQCPKPWYCAAILEQPCKGMTERWWAYRHEVARRQGVRARRCLTGSAYEPLPPPAAGQP